LNLRITLLAAFVVHALGGVYLWATYSPVRPIVECVEQRKDGRWVAHFGWSTQGEEPHKEPVGSSNRMFGAGIDAEDVGQPTSFVPGRTPKYPKAPLQIVFKGAVTWELGNHEVTAYQVSNICTLDEQKAVPEMPQIQKIKVEPPKPKEEPPPPPPKKEEPPPPKEEPKVEKTKPKPKKATVRKKGQPKRKKKPKKQPKVEPKKAEPVPVTLTNVNLSGTGIAVQKGEQDNFGDPSVKATRSNSNQAQGEKTQDGGGDPGGTGDGPATKPKRPPKIVSPKVLSRPSVKWPAEAPLLGRVVTVRLSLTVGKDGKVKKVKVIKGAGNVFNKAAIKVAKKIKFKPGTRGGKPIVLPVPWTVVFQPAS